MKIPSPWFLPALIGAACSPPVEQPQTPRAPSGRSELGVFMKTQLNPPFSKLSFLLFHTEDATTEIDPAALPAAGAELAQAAANLTRWTTPPGDSEQGKQVFFEYAEALKVDTATLVAALQATDKPGAVKAFESLRKKCDSCHHFFRFDESASFHGAGSSPIAWSDR